MKKAFALALMMYAGSAFGSGLDTLVTLPACSDLAIPIVSEETGECLQMLLPGVQLGLYTFSGNPAGLSFDMTRGYVHVTASARDMFNHFGRLFDPHEVQGASFNAQTLQRLGESGAFLGRFKYYGMKELGIHGSLRSQPYLGDPFFISDTSKGDYRYYGPEVEFIHSFNPIRNLTIGLAIEYSVSDGLKNAYSRAHNVVRSVDASTGAIVYSNNRMLYGLSFRVYSSQERIESKMEELLDVDVFTYRGDLYATRRRGQSLEEKVRLSGVEISMQAANLSCKSFTLMGYLRGNRTELQTLIPTAFLKESEDGYTQFENLQGDLLAQWRLSHNFQMSGNLKAGVSNSWSELSAKKLLIWEWSYQYVHGILTVARSVSHETRMFLQGTLRVCAIDSSKYIDNRFTELRSLQFGAQIGGESTLLSRVGVRLGLGYGAINADPVVGGNDARRFFAWSEWQYQFGSGIQIAATYSYVRSSIHASNGVVANSNSLVQVLVSLPQR
ncbi:MAG: DUF6850 family outer membrane beta-barrel protein [Bacteroidota bacterium]